MSLKPNDSYEALGVFCLRIAALPTSTLDAWVGNSADSSDLARWTKEQFARPFLREALYVASPSFSERLEIATAQPSNNESYGDLTGTLSKYLARACYRATPFGLFAGVTAGVAADRTRLLIRHRDAWKRRVRLDHAFLHAETEKSLAHCRQDLSTRLIVNSTIYTLGKNLRYWTPAGKDKEHAYRHSQVGMTPPLALVLRWCERPCSREALLGRLIDAFPAAADAQLDTFIENLVTTRILVDALAVPLTSSDAFGSFLSNCPSHPAFDELRALKSQVDSLDGTAVGDEDSSLVRAIAHAGTTKHAREEKAAVFHVDTECTADCLTLGNADIAAIAEAVEVWELLSVDSDGDDGLRDLARRFVDRWEHSLVPLALVVDEEAGLTAGQTAATTPDYLRTLDLRVASSRRGAFSSSDAEQWLLNRIGRAIDKREFEIVLDNADLDILREKKTNRSDLPPSIGVVLSMYESPVSTLSPVIWLESIANSGSALMGRFCLSSAPVHEAVMRVTSEEQLRRPDVVLAEIVHLPRPRAGNVIARPILRDYEIPYAGISGAPHDHQLRLDDLFVGVDQDHRFFLWSKKLQRRVVPALSCAHNVTLENGLAAYRFLHRLSTQAQRRFTPILPKATMFPRVPRIRWGRCVLRAASWQIEKAEFESLKTEFDLDGNIHRWANERSLPRLTTYGFSDQTLVLDLSNPLLLRCFFDGRHRFPIQLREASPAQMESAAMDAQGKRYRHEIVLPMLLRAEKSATENLRQMADARDGAHLPGGRWLSYKIYGGIPSLDRFLFEELLAIVEKHCGVEANTWFFVRYADPDFHIRLRFYGAQQHLYSSILPTMHSVLAPHSAAGSIARVQIDTYVPELARYGGNEAMPFVENLFCADSEMHLRVLSELQAKSCTRESCLASTRSSGFCETSVWETTNVLHYSTAGVTP